MSSSIVKELAAFFATQDKVQVALLFGSYAKGKQIVQSDIDIAVSFGKPISFDEKLLLLAELTELTQRKIDIVDLESVHGVILGQALAGLKVKVTDPIHFARLLKRHLLDDADFGPLRRRILDHRRKAYFGK